MLHYVGSVGPNPGGGCLWLLMRPQDAGRRAEIKSGLLGSKSWDCMLL